MMASGEIRLSGTTMRQMPVLAQSQTTLPEQTVTAQSQAPQSGQSIDMSPSSDGLDPVVVTAQSGHYYRVTAPLSDDCSEADAFNAMRSYSASGAPYAQDGPHKVTLTGNNPILQIVDPTKLTITNQTLPGHIFGGSVVISIFTSNGVVSADIVGSGLGPNSEWNQMFGPDIFQALGFAAYMSLQHGTTNPGP